ncbi:glycosyltransferase family 2 protein [Yersinia kristensenii]|uniref:glycosyltransferase family 2 protein n=1 Tax=Yersinia kristensenii TaxID=28152 RepID=UPI001C60D00D|nr:glycosyltransferase family 2 protein [Yersinia kristensenii]MBW5810718.1 glycosyltransferase family 2 protein [Yersinia kristensenii]MBW5827851.1 glycosyltransferase family 2 protein [Yersinia kristensenii]MBW5843693.1 glycosyltransferase family 2 protein [Yersinia kristensenii]MDA5490465.1 glycosyltransferase family 2 protein [Yersinia kristensenii]
MMFESPSIDIVLATYNGEKYISEQISSILNMNGFSDLIKKIIICDDNSNDRTLSIIESMVPSEKLIILKNKNKNNYGPVKNFERGILYSNAEFVMLSDQDDVWDANKLSIYLTAISSMDREKPILVFSDLEVVDAELNTLSSSFLAHQSIPPSWVSDINNILIQNAAPGCTMLFNRQLVEKALPLSENCIMHDWWLLLVAKQLGNVFFINNRLIKYRQHGKNQVGAKKNGLLQIICNFGKLKNIASKNLAKTIAQMNDFSSKFEYVLNDSTRGKILAWNQCYFGNSGLYKKIYLMKKFGLRKTSFIKTLGLYYLILFGKK